MHATYALLQCMQPMPCYSACNPCLVTVRATHALLQCVQPMPCYSACNPCLVTVRSTHATLQSLLAAPVSAARVIPQQEQTIQVITLPASSNLITTSQPDGAGQVWQVVPNIGNPEIATIIAVADPSELIQATKTDIGGTGLLCCRCGLCLYGKHFAMMTE